MQSCCDKFAFHTPNPLHHALTRAAKSLVNRLIFCTRSTMCFPKRSTVHPNSLQRSTVRILHERLN